MSAERPLCPAQGPDAQPLVLRWQCETAERDYTVGCKNVTLRRADGSVEVGAAAELGADVSSAVWSHVHEALAGVPWLRLETTDMSELQVASRLPWVCMSVGHDRNSCEHDAGGQSNKRHAGPSLRRCCPALPSVSASCP